MLEARYLYLYWLCSFREQGRCRHYPRYLYWHAEGFLLPGIPSAIRLYVCLGGFLKHLLLVSFVLWAIAIRQLGTLLYFYNLFEHSGQVFCVF